MPKNKQPLKENSLVVLRERQVLEQWRTKGESSLPLANALKLYEMYLQGYSCDEIYRINAGRIPLGQILDACEKYNWDERKSQQLDSVYKNIEEKVVKTKNDAIVHITDLIAAVHKVWGDKIKLFLQEGDLELIKGMDLTNLKLYKELLGMLQTLTVSKDSSSDKKVQVDGTVSHVHVLAGDNKRMTSGQADEFLKLLEANGETLDG